jgi:uncharacterized FlgJ-related protein
MSPGQATEAYIKLRDMKKQKDDEHKESLKKLVAAMDKIEAGILEFLQTSGANSIASDAGTAYKSTQLSATVEDKELFMAFVKETDQYEALDVKANKTFVKDYMEENQEVPPGVKVSQMATIGVQRK